MKERPILFSGGMVRAILDGRKTQTRRVMKYQPLFKTFRRYVMDDDVPEAWQDSDDIFPLCPYGVPGDRLWVRETWADTNGESGPMISYKAGGDKFLIDDSYPVDYSKYPGCQFTMWCGDLRRGAKGHSWRPSIHMPRLASRITLEVTGVRVERLQDISEEDAKAEGAKKYMWYQPDGRPESESRYLGGKEQFIKDHIPVYRNGFATLWDSINAKRGFGWDENPWVWVIEFRGVENA